MKSSFLVSASVMGLLLGGCTLAPKYQQPELSLPDQPIGQLSGHSDQGERLEKWWTQFDSPALNSWIEQVRTANLDLQYAQIRIEQSRAALGIQNSTWFPSLSAQGNGTRQQYALDQIGAEGSRIQNRFSLSGMLSYELDLFGKLRSSRSAAKETLLATEYAYQSVENALISETIITWFNLIAAEEKLTLAEETVRTRKEGLELQLTRYKAGFITELESQQAAAELADAEIQVPMLKQSIQQLTTALAVLSGKTPSELWGTKIGGVAIEKLPPSPGINIELMPLSLLQSRPDITAAEAQLRAAYHEIGVAKANRWPTLSLSAALGSSVSTVEDLFKNNGETWSSGASISGPIYDFGRSKNQVKSAEAARDSAEMNYRAVVLESFAELRNAWDGLKYTEETLGARGRQQKAITRTLTLAQSQYENGYSDHLDLLDAERRQFQSDLAIIDARLQHLVSVVQFYKSIGQF